ncbi:MAG: hypothetical protein LC789_01235 [Actinobacteria bacterium]|nr:hypothetical protein [Actinomycetota bacterium]
MSTWPPETGVTLARLAFLAAKPQLQRRARPWWVRLLRIAEVGGTPGGGWRAEGGGMDDEIASGRMSSYAFACDRVVEHLSVDERQALRQSGVLPPWFLPQVEELAWEFRRERR